MFTKSYLKLSQYAHSVKQLCDTTARPSLVGRYLSLARDLSNKGVRRSKIHNKRKRRGNVSAVATQLKAASNALSSQ